MEPRQTNLLGASLASTWFLSISRSGKLVVARHFLPSRVRDLIPAEGCAEVGGGVGFAPLTGSLAIELVLRLVRRGKLGYFAIYCALGGALTVGMGLSGW